MKPVVRINTTAIGIADELNPVATTPEPPATARAAYERANPGASGDQDVVALQSLLAKHFTEPETTDAVAPQPAARKAVGSVSRQWTSRFLKALLGLALVAVAGWMPAQRLFEVSSVEAVVNARLVTVRAPINGIVQLDSRSLGVGQSIDVGAPLVTVKNPRVDTSGINIAREQLSDAEEERQALSSKLENTKAIRDALRSQLAVFRDNRIRQIEAELAEGDARIAAAEQNGTGLVLGFGDLLENRQRRVALKRRLAGAHLVQHRAQAEQVGARIGLLAQRLLGGHVQRRAGDEAGARQLHVVGDAGQAEVGQLDAIVRRLQQDVARLDVAVDQPLRVGRGQPVRRLHADAHDLAERQLLFAVAAAVPATRRR